MTHQLTKVDNLIATVFPRSKALRQLKKVDPRDRFVLFCPDHSTVKVGTGRSLTSQKQAREVYSHASSLLNEDLLQLSQEGPESALIDHLRNRHTVAYVTSHAAITQLKYDKPSKIPFIKAAAGIGVGFINSLVFSEAISFEDGLELVRARAEAIDRTIKLISFHTLLLTLSPATPLVKICKAAREHCLAEGVPNELALCSISQRINQYSVCVTGHKKAIEFLEQSDHLFKFRSTTRQTSVSYYTKFMKPIEQYMNLYIDDKLRSNSNYLREPSTCSVYSATAGRRLRSLDQIKQDIAVYPTRCLQVQQLINSLYSRPKNVPQPNTLVLWDRRLHKNMSMINRKAWAKSELVGA